MSDCNNAARCRRSEIYAAKLSTVLRERPNWIQSLQVALTTAIGRDDARRAAPVEIDAVGDPVDLNLDRLSDDLGPRLQCWATAADDRPLTARTNRGPGRRATMSRFSKEYREPEQNTG